MKKYLFLICFLFLSLTVASTASAVVIGFDDLTVDGYNVKIQDGYGGLDWDNMYVTDNQGTYYNGGYMNAAVSGNNVAYNGYADLAVSSSQGNEFNFDGAYFTAAWNQTVTLTIKGYNGTSELFSMDYEINKNGPTWCDADFLGVDRITMVTDGQHFAMDDFTYENAAAVPEPSTLLLLGAGLLGFIGRRKKIFS